jgi:hypothetical protein
VRVDIVLTCGKHFHGHIISQEGEALIHKTSLTPPIISVVPVPSLASVYVYIYVLGVSILSLFLRIFY